MQTIVGVLRGGPSREHEVSLASGAVALAALPESRYVARDIYIDRQGVWHERGRPVAPDKVLRQIDLALLPLHGAYGGMGEVQKLLELFGVPYIGPDAYGAHLATHKVIAKAKAREAGVLTPDFYLVEHAGDAEAAAREIIRTLQQPVVVKPIAGGSAIGVSIEGGYAPVLAAIETLFAAGASAVLVEERIRGREAAVGVVEGLRGESLYVLPTIEIISPEGDFYSFNARQSGEVRHVCPGNFSRVQTEELQRITKVMHRELNQRHYSHSDFIIAPKGIYYLETNGAPAVGLTPESLLPKSLAAVGVSLPDFLSHLVNLALSR